MTHIHGKHHVHKTPAHKPAAAPKAAAATAAGAPQPKVHHDKNEVHFADAQARAKAQKEALAKHSHSDVHDFDKAFHESRFSLAQRAKAAIDAKPMHPPKTYKVVADDARVRTHPMGLVTANVKHGDRFVVEATKTDKHGNTWAWGYAMGGAKKPGWMPLKAGDTHVLKETDEKPPKGYHPAGEPVNQAKLWNLKYVTGKDKKDKGMDYTMRFTVKDTNPNAKIYANVDGQGHVHGEIQKLKPGDVVRVRYSLDGKTAMVLRQSDKDDDKHAKWGYVKLKDVQYAPLKNDK